ncbi:exonuclease, partial [Opisthorchis viverrini]
MGRLIVKRYACPFSIKCTQCTHSENITHVSNEAPLDARTPVAIDCEMVGVGPEARNALGRVSVVSYTGAVLYDVMVRPEEKITDFRTRWSGIRPFDMRRSIPFACAQEQVERIIRDRIVVGHMVHNDFNVLKLKHPCWLIRDTAKAAYAKLVAGFPTDKVVGLRALTLRLFGTEIQKGEHCSIEDARATMAIYRVTEKVWETELRRTAQLNCQPCGETDLLSSSPCDFDGALSCATPSCKRTSNGTESLSLDHLPMIASKRLCKEGAILSTKKTEMFRSSSSSSLLDDSFWPDDAGVLLLKRPLPLSLLAYRVACLSVQLNVDALSSCSEWTRWQNGNVLFSNSADLHLLLSGNPASGLSNDGTDANSPRSDLPPHFRRHVTPKKQHEIQKLSSVAGAVANSRPPEAEERECDLPLSATVVDIGSGQGHLSRYLSLKYGLNVVSLEADSTHLEKASKFDRLLLLQDTTVESFRTPSCDEPMKIVGPITCAMRISSGLIGADMNHMLQRLLEVDDS